MEIFCGAMIYADDVAILAPSRAGLQILMDACSKYGLEWDISFNPKKSQAMVIGPNCKVTPALVLLSGGMVSWVTSFKYLGVFIQAHKAFQCEISTTVRKFYKSLNSLLRFRTQPSDVVQIHLLMTHCAPILTYGIEVQQLNRESCQLIKVAYNSIFRRVLHYRRNESVTDVRNLFGYDDWESLCIKRRDGFLRRLEKSSNALLQLLLSLS